MMTNIGIVCPTDQDLSCSYIEQIAEAITNINYDYIIRYGFNLDDLSTISYEHPRVSGSFQIVDCIEGILERRKATCLEYCCLVAALWRIHGKPCKVLVSAKSDLDYHSYVGINNGDSFQLFDVTQELFGYIDTEVHTDEYCCDECAAKEMQHSCTACSLA